MPHVVEYFRYVKENASSFKTLIKKLINLYAIDKSWLIQESLGLNPDWWGDINIVFYEKFNHYIIA